MKLCYYGVDLDYIIPHYEKMTMLDVLFSVHFYSSLFDVGEKVVQKKKIIAKAVQLSHAFSLLIVAILVNSLRKYEQIGTIRYTVNSYHKLKKNQLPSILSR